MDKDIKFEESIVNYVRNISLSEQRSNPNSKFDSIAINVKTLTNNGYVSNGEISVNNACFFISVAQCTKLDPFRLLLCSEYEHWNEVLDTDRKEDLECVKRVASYVDRKINIYSGKKIENGLWKINPTPLSVIDIPDIKKEVLIVTDNSHFECIIPEESQKLIQEPTDIDIELAIKLQKQSEMYLYLSSQTYLMVKPRHVGGLEVILLNKKEILGRSAKPQMVIRKNYKIVFNDAVAIICRKKNDEWI